MIEKAKKVHFYITHNYGIRGCWISELAEQLHLSYTDANYLTLALGYHRGRVLNITPFESFISDDNVKAIIEQIQI